MRIVIELEPDELTVGAYIDGVERPTQDQAVVLRGLASLAGRCRTLLVKAGA